MLLFDGEGTIFKNFLQEETTFSRWPNHNFWSNKTGNDVREVLSGTKSTSLPDIVVQRGSCGGTTSLLHRQERYSLEIRLRRDASDTKSRPFRFNDQGRVYNLTSHTEGTRRPRQDRPNYAISSIGIYHVLIGDTFVQLTYSPAFALIKEKVKRAEAPVQGRISTITVIASPADAQCKLSETIRIRLTLVIRAGCHFRASGLANLAGGKERAIP